MPANDGNPRGVHRSVSASSSSNPRRGSMGAEHNNANVICESSQAQVATTPAAVAAQKPIHPVAQSTPAATAATSASDENEADAIILQGGTEDLDNENTSKVSSLLIGGFDVPSN